MVDALVVAICVSAVTWAVASGVLALRGVGLSLVPVVLAGLTAVLVGVQAVIVAVGLASGERPGSVVLVVSYLVAVVLVPPVGTFWALGDRSRWGNVVHLVAGVAVATMTVRLWDLWRP